MSEISNEVSVVNKDTLMTNLSVLATPDGFQKYILGYKKNKGGDPIPRSVYDIIKDQNGSKKKKKKGKKNKKGSNQTSVYDVYLKGKKKKKKKGKKNKYWHI